MEESLFYQLALAVEGVEFKERKSKFIGFAYPAQNEQEIASRLTKLREMHPQANHHCYAWRLGSENSHYRANDDGEPRNSAGLPIYRQFQARDLTASLVVVVRYFGGTKLGVGGLIQAYGDCAALTLESAQLIPYIVRQAWMVRFPYDQQSRVERIIEKAEGQKIFHEYKGSCTYHVEIPEKHNQLWQAEMNRYPPLNSKRLA